MSRLFVFVGGRLGPWRVVRMETLVGPPLEQVERVDILPGPLKGEPPESRWLLRGVVSHERYVTRPERESLAAVQQGLGRPEATCAALIPIRKSEAWWELTQEERRAIFEDRAHHIAVGLSYLPAVARRLHHSRDLGEPFDFLTWFEYAPAYEEAFEELVATLRKTGEWRYVEREVDIRLVREAVSSGSKRW